MFETFYIQSELFILLSFKNQIKVCISLIRWTFWVFLGIYLMYTKRNVNVKKKKKPWSHRKIHIHVSTDLNRLTCEEARLRVCVLCPESSKNGTGDLKFFQLYLKTQNHYYLQIQKGNIIEGTECTDWRQTFNKLL